MPIYEYQCKDCGEEFERLMPISAQNPPECPKCGGGNVKKKISRPASGKSNCGSCSATSCGGCSSARHS
ncbi:MAG: FmdB family zinc ribbon protein [Desulfomonilia bacterium]|jgi:putative FmdB family regulatory protein|uniref:Zinc ribbon domain protein n=1 Tax=anaerobic digester metagenome TaxID=1263854 RepID=A0A485LZE5_9ZZZZ|nr:zinc ribbon domain-containing protein [Pseudomonadota bacterium]HON37833.1 zinc ribbon domain-containing protein [Deltaproteobacteria bacterium]HRS55881.1 zinc ribbon domain-containing protein [Desulfomonilia bacterium]HPD21092.1 zinc ribbon domain-containing protein [Deltaproteobacteria bacterium]HPX17998.1 zinc ribbon domain-containing protein [Deltaproteobacteria bacterium]